MPFNPLRFIKKKQKPFLVSSPGQRQVVGDGDLNPGSPTWAFVFNWGQRELDKARESNDSLSKDAVQTACLRGRIKALKELIALPEKETKEGLLQMSIREQKNDGTFAGY